MRNISRFAMHCRVIFALCIAIVGCTADQRYAATLDQMADAEAEYGTMGISAPVLASPNSNFAFDLTANADTFFSDALKSRQGSVSELQQNALSFGFGLKGTFNPAEGAAYTAQVQQYQQAVANNNGAQSTINLKNSLQNSAAYTQYQADVQQANSLTDPVAKADAIATARSKLASSIVGPAPTTLPAFPTPASQPSIPTDLVGRPTDLLQQFANGGNFATFQGLATNTPSLGVTDRTALMTAGGDNATKAIFRLLGDPNLVGGFKEKKVLFAVCTVSVQPGWRTQKGFAADVANVATFKYVDARPAVVDQYLKERAIPQALRERLREQFLGYATPPFKLPNIPSSFVLTSSVPYEPLYGRGPLVAVISPLTDTQTLDLQSSDRREREIALSLAIAAELAKAGISGQAQSFLKYAQSVQQDFASVSPDVVVNSYSTGTVFGFQVGPRLRAVQEASAGKYSGAAEILDRQSFPALVILGIEQSAWFPQVRWDDTSKKYDIYEPVICIQSVNRWVPARKREPYENIWGISYLGRVFMDRQYRPLENENLRWLPNLDAIENLEADKTSQKSISTRLLQLHEEEIETRVLGGESNSYLPLQMLRLNESAEITAVQPATVEAGAKSRIALTGHDLDDLDLTKISTVIGNVDSGTIGGQLPFNPVVRDGVLFLEFTPSITPSFPDSSLLDENLNAARVNLEVSIAYASRLGPQITAASAAIQNTIRGDDRLAFLDDLRAKAEKLGPHSLPPPGTAETYIKVLGPAQEMEQVWNAAEGKIWGDVKDQLLTKKNTAETMSVGANEGRASRLDFALHNVEISTVTMADTVDPTTGPWLDLDLAVKRFVKDISQSAREGIAAEPLLEIASASLSASRILDKWNSVPHAPGSDSSWIASYVDMLRSASAAGAIEDQLRACATSLAQVRNTEFDGPEVQQFERAINGANADLLQSFNSSLASLPPHQVASANVTASMLNSVWLSLKTNPTDIKVRAQFETVANAAAASTAGGAVARITKLDDGLSKLRKKMSVQPNVLPVLESVAFEQSLKAYTSVLAKALDNSLTEQPFTDLADSVVAAAVLDDMFQKASAHPWTTAAQSLLSYFENRATRTDVGKAEAILSGLDQTFAAFGKSLSNGSTASVSFEKGSSGAAIRDAISQFRSNLTRRLKDNVGIMLTTLEQIDGVERAKVDSRLPSLHSLTMQQDELKALLASIDALPTVADENVLAGSIGTTTRNSDGVADKVLQAYAAKDEHQVLAKDNDNSAGQATTLSNENIEVAQKLVGQLESAAGSTLPAAGVGNVMAGNSALAANLAAAQANLVKARTLLTEAQPVREQTIVFALPSKSDPQHVIYSPPISVRGGDPSDLLVAPQTIQLQTMGPAGGGNAASGNGTNFAAGSTTANANPNQIAVVPQSFTVLIAGNNLNHVDITGIAMVPASKQPLGAHAIGTSIAVDITVNSVDSPIYFVLPISGSSRHVTTPPIAVKAAPQNPGTSPTAVQSNITSLFPPGVALTRDPSTHLPNPKVQTFQILLVGSNLDQLDLSSLAVFSGPASVDQSVGGAPTIASGIIRLTLQVTDSTAPIVISGSRKSDKTQIVKSAPLVVQ